MTEEWDVCAPWEFVFWMKMARSCRDAGKIWVKFLKLMFPVWIQELQRQNSQSCVMSIIRSVGKMEQPIHSVHKREEPRRV